MRRQAILSVLAVTIFLIGSWSLHLHTPARLQRMSLKARPTSLEGVFGAWRKPSKKLRECRL